MLKKIPYLFTILLVLSPFTKADKDKQDSYNHPAFNMKIGANCLSDQWDKKKLLKLKENQFEIKADSSRNQLALQLMDCLGSADPVLRDGVAFEALSGWMRDKLLADATHIKLFNTLNEALKNGLNDNNGIYLPFASLVLSEVARVDRIAPFLTQQQRKDLISNAANYLEKLRDYRGFDETIGWRHGIAHTADLMLQLSLNPQIDKSLLDALLASILTQISPNNGHFYIYGESKRLAMPVIYIFLRDLHSPEEWQSWLNKVISPAPLSNWNEAYKSQAGLARLHNTQNFLLNMYAAIKNSKNTALIQMVPPLENAIQTVR